MASAKEDVGRISWHSSNNNEILLYITDEKLDLKKEKGLKERTSKAWHFYGRLSTVPVSRNFFNSLLTPRFVQLFSGNSSVNLFAVYPFKYKLFKSKSCPRRWIPCWVLMNTAVTSAVTNFRCHKLIAKKMSKNSDMEKLYLRSFWGKTRP